MFLLVDCNTQNIYNEIYIETNQSKEKKMSKKILSFFLCAALLLPLSFSSQAKVYISDTVSPEIVSVSETDGTITFNIDTPEASQYEQARLALYGGLKDTYTDEQLTENGFSYLINEIKLICEISADGNSWYTAKTADTDADTLTLSVYEEALPCLQNSGVDMKQIWNGFELQIRFLVSNSNYEFSVKQDYFVKTEPSETVKTKVSQFGYIDYCLPEKTDNSLNRVFFTYPLTEDIVLSNPVREGYTFDGWENENGQNINRLSKDTRYSSLTAKWLPKTYKINYVITTHTQHNFSGTNNTMNPKKYTPENAEEIKDLVSPVEGFVFGGWFGNPEYKGEKINEIPKGSSGDIVLYALWLTDEEKELYDIKQAFWGDLNGDYAVTSADARIALRAAVGLEKLPAHILARADFNRHGKLTSGDARTLLRIAVGLESLTDILKSNNLI